MHGQRIGYVRVSSFDQNPERQLEQIQVDKVFTDKASGKDTRRPELERLLAFVREGDTVVVHSMDRLARNLDDLRRLVQGLTQRGVRIEFLKEHLTFTGEDSPMANLMLSVMGAFAEFERTLISSVVGRQPNGSCARRRTTVPHPTPSAPQRRHHWSGSTTRQAITARSGSRRCPTATRPSSSRRVKVVRSGQAKVASGTSRSSR